MFDSTRNWAQLNRAIFFFQFLFKISERIKRFIRKTLIFTPGIIIGQIVVYIIQNLKKIC